MCRTPAPPSTAAVARAIWSGVGEVKTAPGHAASSMPRPTQPPCRGSWPLPPPETSPTLPLRGASLRMITFGSYSTRIRSECAAAIPAMASLTSLSGVLISFLSRVVTAASAIAASSYLLLAVGKTRRNRNIPIPFPISRPRPMASRLIPSATGSNRGASRASITAPKASPAPPINRMRFSRWRGVRATARGRGEGSIPRPPGALPICRLSRRDTVLLRPRPRRFRDRNSVRTNGSRQVLVDEHVVDPRAEGPANQRHPGRHQEVEVLTRDRIRAVPEEQPPDPRPEVTRRVQGRHLYRGKDADQGGHDEADRDRRQVGRRRDPVLDDAEDADHQDRGNDDLGSGASPPGILRQVIGARERRMTRIPDQPRVRPVRPEDQPAQDAVIAASRDFVGSLVRDDHPVPHEGHADGRDERADELRADVPRHLRPRKTTPPGQRQRDRGVQMRPRNRAGRVDGERDRETPEESRSQQAGPEANPAGARRRIGDEAVAEENQKDRPQDFAQVFLSPAFGYRHSFLLPSFD